MVAPVYGAGEESPGFTGQGCWLTTSEGDFKDSATEINRHCFYNGKDGKVR